MGIEETRKRKQSLVSRSRASLPTQPQATGAQIPGEGRGPTGRERARYFVAGLLAPGWRWSHGRVPSTRLLDRKIRSQGKCVLLRPGPFWCCRTDGRQCCEPGGGPGAGLRRTQHKHRQEKRVDDAAEKSRRFRGRCGPGRSRDQGGRRTTRAAPDPGTSSRPWRLRPWTPQGVLTNVLQHSILLR